MGTRSALKRMAFASFLTVSVMCCADGAHAQSTDSSLTSYINALNASMPPGGDPATVVERYSPDGVQYHPFGEPPGGPLRGREALAKFYARFQNFWADWTHVERSRLVEGNRAVYEGTAEGHHRDSGKFVRLPIVFFLDFDDQGKIRDQRTYVDIRSVAE
jgi:ketosteroid isomerase-like protein